MFETIIILVICIIVGLSILGYNNYTKNTQSNTQDIVEAIDTLADSNLKGSNKLGAIANKELGIAYSSVNFYGRYRLEEFIKIIQAFYQSETIYSEHYGDDTLNESDLCLKVIINPKQEESIFIKYNIHGDIVSSVEVKFKHSDFVKIESLQVALTGAKVLETPSYYHNFSKKPIMYKDLTFPNIVGKDFSDVVKESIALVERGNTGKYIFGKSGTGKSTMIELLMYQIWDEDTCIIKLDPDMIRSSELDDIRQFILSRKESKIVLNLDQEFESYFSNTQTRTKEIDVLSSFIRSFGLTNKKVSWFAAGNINYVDLMDIWKTRFPESQAIKMRMLNSEEMEKAFYSKLAPGYTLSVDKSKEYSYSDIENCIN